jgi:hypothetical protein
MRAVLVDRARVCLGSQLLRLRGQPVAHALQLPKIQQRRALLRADGDDLGDVGKPVRDDRRQFPLEASNLRLQRFARRTLRLRRAGNAEIECSSVNRFAAAHRRVA